MSRTYSQTRSQSLNEKATKLGSRNNSRRPGRLATRGKDDMKEKSENLGIRTRKTGRNT